MVQGVSGVTTKNAHFAICAQEGLAHVCLVGTSTTVIRAKVESNLPRKRGAAAAGYDKVCAITDFYKKCT
jgi:protein pelota